MRNPLLATFLPLVLVAPAGAATVTVSKGGAIPTIQQGIDAASAGDTVEVQAGVYQENVTIVASKVGLRLVGLGGTGAVVIEARPAGGAAAGPGVQVDADDVRIVGIVVQNAREPNFGEPGSGFRVTADGFFAQKCVARGCTPAGFEFEGTGKPRLKKCSTLGGTSGVLLTSATDAQLSKCSLRAHDLDAVILDGCAGVTIRGCRFLAINGSGIATGTNGNSNVRVSKCRLQQCTSSAIVLSDGSPLIVEKNRIRECEGAIEVFEAAVARVRGNIVDGTQDNTSLLVDACGDAIVENNSIRRAAIGPYSVQDSIEMRVRNNEAIECAVTDDFVFECDSAGGVFTGNRVRDCVGIGFAVLKGDCDLSDNLVSGIFGDDGIFVDASAANTLLEDNSVRGSGAEGLDHRGQNSIVRNNSFLKCRLDLTNSGTAQFKANVFKTGGENVPAEID